MYGRQYGRGGYGNDLQRFLRNTNAPVTLAIIAANLLTFVLGFGGMRSSLAGTLDAFLSFSAGRVAGPDGHVVQGAFPTYFWTAVTWPLMAPQNLIGLLFGALMFFWVSSSLERAWGSRNFGLFMAATSALTAITLYVGTLILGTVALLNGLYYATAAPLIAWAVINRRETISLYGVLPIPAPILAWATVALMWFDISRMGGHPLIGLFSLSGCGLAYWYATKGRAAMGGFTQFRMDAVSRNTSVFTSGTTSRKTRGDDAPVTTDWNPLTRWKQAREKREQDKRLEDMFRRSGYDDEKRRK